MSTSFVTFYVHILLSHQHRVNQIVRSCLNNVGIQHDQQRLLYGKQLSDDETMADLGIGHGAVMHLVLRLRGVGVVSTFADVINSSALVRPELPASPPDWRVAGPGLNVEGLCKNRE